MSLRERNWTLRRRRRPEQQHPPPTTPPRQRRPAAPRWAASEKTTTTTTQDVVVGSDTKDKAVPRQVQRIFTFSAIDYVAENFRSVHFTMFLWVTVVVAYFSYVAEVSRNDA